MRLFKLSIIIAAVLCVSAVHAADKKESQKAPSAAPAVSEGKIDLVISGMT